jgi:hypothetical protein
LAEAEPQAWQAKLVKGLAMPQSTSEHLENASPFDLRQGAAGVLE